MFPLVSGTFRLIWSVSGPARRVLTGFRSCSDSLPVSLLSLSLSLDDALDLRRIPPRSRVARGELGRAKACSILSALEERSRLERRQIALNTWPHTIPFRGVTWFNWDQLTFSLRPRVVDLHSDKRIANTILLEQVFNKLKWFPRGVCCLVSASDRSV